MHPGHRHGEAQRNSQQVQNVAAGLRLQQQGAQGGGKETTSRGTQSFLIEQRGHKGDLTWHSCFQLMKIMVKVSDISNEARPMAVAEPWLDCLLQEFFNQVIHFSSQKQTWRTIFYPEFCPEFFDMSEWVSVVFCFDVKSDTEKLKGLPVTPFMDRDKVSKPSSQTNFIRFVLLPLFSELTKLFPCLEVKYQECCSVLLAALRGFRRTFLASRKFDLLCAWRSAFKVCLPVESL